MNPIVLGLTAVILYLAAASPIALAWLKSPVAAVRPTFFGSLALGSAAVVLHGMLLYQTLIGSAGINLGVFNAASLVTWLIAAILIGMSLFTPLANLSVLVFPAAALALGLDFAFSSQRLLPHSSPTGVDVHIVLSLLAYSVLAIAALQSVVLALADYRLRHQQPLQVMRLLPPLATMEDLMFRMLGIGLLLLTLGLASGFMFVENLLTQHLAHKTVLSILAWLVFAVLLWGRRARGWRGRIAVTYTLCGFALLALAFFGSEIVLQLILHRV